jgi:hypothetical protein
LSWINNDDERKDVSEEHKVNNYLDQSEGSKPDRPPETEVRDGITDTDVIEQPPDRPPETEVRDGLFRLVYTRVQLNSLRCFLSF